MLAALSFRRSVDADENTWVAAGVLAILFQLPIILYLSVAPSAQPGRPLAEQEQARNLPGWIGGLQGMLAGVGVTLAAVVLSARSYSRLMGRGYFLRARL